MKKLYSFALSVAMMAAATVSASADGIHLGYCMGNLPAKGQGTGAANNTISAAICLTSDMLEPYADCQITSLYIGVPTESTTLPETMTGWLRTSIDGTNITSGTVAAEKGWLTLQLDAPVNVADYVGSELWIGYDYVQPKKISILAFSGEKGNSKSAWVAKNGAWKDYSSQGALSLEAIVEGESLPQHDLMLISCEPNTPKVKIGRTALINGVVRNNALAVAEGFVVNYSVNNGAVTGSTTFSNVLSYRDEAVFQVGIPTEGLEEGMATVSLEVAWTGDIADEIASNNVGETSLALYLNGFDRTILLEEFTTEQCPNCPSAVSRLNSALDNYNLRNRVVWVCHHSGFYTDFLTISESNTYMAFYGQGQGTYAPAIMVDRTYDEGYSDAAGNAVTAFPDAPAWIASWLNLHLEEPAFADVQIVSATYNEGQITIKVVAEKSEAFDALTTEPRINVWVKESNIDAHAQGGITEAQKPGYHENAIRKVLTDVWGTPFTWDGMKYEAEFTCEAGSDWKVEDLEAVAFLNRYTASTRGREVYNSTQAKIIQSSTGISAVGEDVAAPAAAYNLNGVRVEMPQSGLNVVDGKVVFIKK